VKAIPLVAHWRNAVRDSDLDRTAKLVALVLSTYMDHTGAAWPAKTTIARGASLGRVGQKGNTAVDSAIDRLEAAGLLVVDRRRGRRGFLYGAAIPRDGEGFESHVATRDNGGQIPRGWDAKSLAEYAEIPRPGEGESAESAESVSARASARTKTSRAHSALQHRDLDLELAAYDV
jgi:hypothetical protein